MNPVSVVIITRNEETNIVDCIRSARLVSSDIIVVDSGSRDKTVEFARQEGAAVYSIPWTGYGQSRNYGAASAKNNWIVSIDADERLSSKLADSIRQLDLSDSNVIFKFRRENYLGKRKIRFGTPGYDSVSRIYNRLHCQWDLTLVHEKLIGKDTKKKFIQGPIIHYAFRNLADYRVKTCLYAQMSADKYKAEGRKASFVKRFISPLFNSVKSYVFQAGFLDGHHGFIIAKTIARYTWLKYYYLYQMNLQQNPNNQQVHKTEQRD